LESSEDETRRKSARFSLEKSISFPARFRKFQVIKPGVLDRFSEAECGDEPKLDCYTKCMTINIRSAALSDARAGARVQLETWRATYRNLMPREYLASLNLEEFEKNWKSAIESLDGTRLRILAEENKQIVGYLSAGPPKSQVPEYSDELFGIYVHPSHQGKRIGKKLLRFYQDWLLQRRSTSFLLWVLRENIGSRRFYEATGGIELGLEKADRSFGGSPLIEVAYGWKDLNKN